MDFSFISKQIEETTKKSPTVEQTDYLKRLPGGGWVVEPMWYFPPEARTFISTIQQQAPYTQMLAERVADWLGLKGGGGLAPVFLPGYSELERQVADTTRRLASKYIGAGVGYSTQFYSDLGDILRGFYREVADIYTGKVLDYAKLLASLSAAQYEPYLSILGLGRFISPDVYIPAPTTTTQIVKEEKPVWGYLLEGLGVGLGYLLGRV